MGFDGNAGFSQPIAGGGGSLVIPQIQSPNFVEGSAGWQVKQDGSAEFNDVTIRGSVVEDGVYLLYNGTPALGTLIFSIAATAGFDTYGNSYPTGVNFVGTPGGGTVNITPYSGAAGESPEIELATAAGIASTFTLIRATTTPSNANEVGVFQGPSSLTDAEKSFVRWLLFTATSGATDGAFARLDFNDNTGSYPLIIGQKTGITATGMVTAQEPGATLPTNETWHTVTPATGWSVAGVTSPPLSYKLNSDNTVSLAGNIKFTTGTPTSPATMCNIPAAYTPQSIYYSPSPSGGFWFLIEVAPTGAVIVQNWDGHTLPATLAVYVNMRYPLDL